uniref:Transmembrane protein n=1 Tax=Medicago truncatula TaxID=3880 RepID=I3SPG6_MEDTR|nr:unknown [Medicago truncatula]
MELALEPVLLVEHAGSLEENVHLITFLHLTFAQNKDLQDLQLFIKCLVLAMFLSCSCIYQLMNVVKLLSQLLMRLKLVSETLCMVVSLTFLPYNNR